MKREKPSVTFVSRVSPRHGWTAPGTMPSPFTAFVRSQQGAETPDADLFHDAWDSLQAALGAELKRRGLWRTPPCYLGVSGYERWDAEETTGDPMAHAWGDARAVQSALGELVSDCWTYIFADRHQSLRKHLAAKDNIDGLVRLNISHFLLERQREHDPIGFFVFERLRDALRQAIEHGELYLLAGDRRIRNSTVLGFEPGAAPRPTWTDLTPIVASWNDRVLSDLLTARGRQEAAVLAALRQLAAELPQHGIHSFRFKDLVDPLKSDARLRWASLLAGEGGTAAGKRPCEADRLPPPVLPECTFECRQSYRHLVACVSASIRMQADPRGRAYLTALWDHLQAQHGDDGEALGGRPADPIEEGRLSHRQLAQRLQIPRERLPMLFASLRQLVAHCLIRGRVRLGGRPADRAAPGPPRDRPEP
jgi:hypothetical protein